MRKLTMNEMHEVGGGNPIVVGACLVIGFACGSLFGWAVSRYW